MVDGETNGGKRISLRWPAVCIDCAGSIPAGTMAQWYSSTKAVRCMPCLAGGVGRNVAGGSAQREYERRLERELVEKQKAVAEDREWRDRVKRERPVAGRVAAALRQKPTITAESQSTVAWKIGAEGERRLGAILDGVPGASVFHDRAVPGSRANIDHIAVVSTGVFVIDAKKYSGRIEVRDVGSVFREDRRLFIAGRDRTKLVKAMKGQVEVVRRVLGPSFADVPVLGALCFVDGDFGVFPAPQVVDDVAIVWPARLTRMLKRAGPLSPAHKQQISDVLGGGLRSAA